MTGNLFLVIELFLEQLSRNNNKSKKTATSSFSKKHGVLLSKIAVFYWMYSHKLLFLLPRWIFHLFSQFSVDVWHWTAEPKDAFSSPSFTSLCTLLFLISFKSRLGVDLEGGYSEPLGASTRKALFTKEPSKRWCEKWIEGSSISLTRQCIKGKCEIMDAIEAGATGWHVKNLLSPFLFKTGSLFLIWRDTL